MFELFFFKFATQEDNVSNEEFLKVLEESLAESTLKLKETKAFLRQREDQIESFKTEIDKIKG
jgi:hypothetical protein